MKTLSSRMNLVDVEVADAHVIKANNRDVNAFDTLCLICAELSIDLTNVTDSDFNYCSLILGNFLSGANSRGANIHSIWFDHAVNPDERYQY